MYDEFIQVCDHLIRWTSGHTTLVSLISSTLAAGLHEVALPGSVSVGPVLAGGGGDTAEGWSWTGDWSLLSRTSKFGESRWTCLGACLRDENGEHKSSKEHLDRNHHGLCSH